MSATEQLKHEDCVYRDIFLLRAHTIMSYAKERVLTPVHRGGVCRIKLYLGVHEDEVELREGEDEMK